MSYRKLVITDVQLLPAEVIVVKLDRGYLNVLIDEANGVVSVHSDWGNTQACWPAQAGKLKEFLVLMDVGYLGRNFRNRSSLGHEIKQRVPDTETISRELKTRILEARRSGCMDHSQEGLIKVDKWIARDWWNAVDQWMSCLEEDGEDLGNYPDGILDITHGEPWYFIEMKDSVAEEFWHDELLPAVQAGIREALKARQDA